MQTLRLRRVRWRPRLRFKFKIRFKQTVKTLFRGAFYAFFRGPKLVRQIEPGRFEEVKRLEYPIKM